MNKGIFITGTDTGVGKTFVTTGLIAALKKMGYSVCPMKPVETGCSVKKGVLIPRDTFKLIRASGIEEPIDLINPYRFKHPLAPAVAAELEKTVIAKKKISSACYRLLRKYDITLVEGAGGIMVPVYKKYLFIDLAKELGLPILIVSRPGLGTINHTLLTIESARKRGVKVLGVIINYASRAKKGLAEKTNPAIIEQVGGIPILGVISHLKRSSDKIFLKIADMVLKRLKTV